MSAAVEWELISLSRRWLNAITLAQDQLDGLVNLLAQCTCSPGSRTYRFT